MMWSPHRPLATTASGDLMALTTSRLAYSPPFAPATRAALARQGSSRIPAMRDRLKRSPAERPLHRRTRTLSSPKGRAATRLGARVESKNRYRQALSRGWSFRRLGPVENPMAHQLQLDPLPTELNDSVVASAYLPSVPLYRRILEWRTRVRHRGEHHAQ
jgi:hypothetical protein